MGQVKTLERCRICLINVLRILSLKTFKNLKWQLRRIYGYDANESTPCRLLTFTVRVISSPAPRRYSIFDARSSILDIRYLIKYLTIHDKHKLKLCCSYKEQALQSHIVTFVDFMATLLSVLCG